MRAALPEPLSGEDEYVIHFGDPTEPDAVVDRPCCYGLALGSIHSLGRPHM